MITVHQQSLCKASNTWHENGQLKSQQFHNNNGKLNGERKEWHENGQLFSRKFYNNGKLDGKQKEWNEHGQLKVHHLYKNGNLISNL